jgi:hypothetical protein
MEASQPHQENLASSRAKPALVNSRQVYFSGGFAVAIVTGLILMRNNEIRAGSNKLQHFAIADAMRWQTSLYDLRHIMRA